MRRTIWLALLWLPLASGATAQTTAPADSARIEVHLPRIVLDDVPFDAWLVPVGGAPGDTFDYRLTLPGRPAAAAGAELTGRVSAGDSVQLRELSIAGSGQMKIVATTSIGPARGQTRVLPGWLSLLPPLIAIALALAFREVVISLLAGVWLGALYLYDWNPLTALWRTLDTYIVGAITDPGHAMILVFSFLLGGMVGIISRNGGTYGVVDKITRHAVGPIRGQLATYFMGLVIFFDDYSNTLIVGPTMRPLTDRLGISREKLAYIVDSTAAPVASIALISGWIGMEVGLIDDALTSMNLPYEPYVVFVQSIPYRFYPVLALFFVLMVILTDRDFGPMLKAELRARREGKVIRDGARPASDFDAEVLTPKEGGPLRWYNAVVPILVLTIVTVLGMYFTGQSAVLSAGEADLGLSNVFGNGDSYLALIWGSFSACAVALVMTMAQRILTLAEALEAWTAGLKAMLFAFVILVLAWALGQITVDVQTAQYLIHLLTGNLDPRLLPVIVFVLCALVSFATGTSWGTMAIMMPVVVPLAVALSLEAGYPEATTYTILLGAVSSVLAGSVWGDHCSPISDTTILSSMATSCDHIDHVRTQMPYALLVGVVGMVVGDIPTAYGMSPWISIVLGSAILLGILYWFGKREDMPATASDPAATP
jgi:Na+/H+ antiporter NhaC